MPGKLCFTAYALALLLTTSQAWPAYNFAKRQSLDNPPAQSEDPIFEEEFDFIIAGCECHTIVLGAYLTL